MIDKIIATIKKHNMLNIGDGVVVGVSGGPDSLALLYILNFLKEKYNLKIYVAHINHNLRGKESDTDQAFVEDICKSWGIPLFIESADINLIAQKNKISLEEAGRKIRYDFFNKVLNHKKAQKIAVAHNADDNAETVLMRIIRGSGLDGLSGIKPVRDNIIRPLIYIQRHEIEQYCNQHEIDFRIDSSNLINIYTRNKIRLQLIPYLKNEFNSNIIDTINRMSSLISDDIKYFYEQANNILDQSTIEQNKEYIVINLDKINKHSKFIIPRIIRCAIQRLQGHLVEIEYINIQNVVNFINNSKTGSIINLPNGLELKKQYNSIIISMAKRLPQKKYNYIINISGNTIISETNSILESYLVEKDKMSFKLDKYTQAFDYDKILGELHIRTRLNGDIFSPKGMRGTKKLKDYFIDEKIPRDDRNEMPLVAVDNAIVWIIGRRINEKYKVDKQTKNVLILKYLQGL